MKSCYKLVEFSKAFGYKNNIQNSVAFWTFAAVLSCSVVSDALPPPWTVARPAPLSMGILQARILEWVATPPSRESSQPRDRTQISHIVGRFFTIWATRKAQEYWSG